MLHYSVVESAVYNVNDQKHFDKSLIHFVEPSVDANSCLMFCVTSLTGHKNQLKRSAAGSRICCSVFSQLAAEYIRSLRAKLMPRPVVTEACKKKKKERNGKCPLMVTGNVAVNSEEFSYSKLAW